MSTNKSDGPVVLKEIAGGVVLNHLRELPDVALWAALDVVKTQGPWALIELITHEFSSRNRPANRLKQP